MEPVEIRNQGAQGDVFFRRVDRIPDGCTEAERVNGAIVVTHSETGHNHEIRGAVNTRLEEYHGGLIAYLSIGDPYADVEHCRSYDTHRTIRLGRGTWEVRRQREYTPEGWRRVED